MPNNLIPTSIVDKNGKRTTVNKKPASAASSNTSAIPAPSVHPAAQAGLTRWEDRDQNLGERFYNAMLANNKGRDLGMDKNVFMMTCNDRMKKLFSDLMEHDEGFGNIISAATSPSLPDRRKPRSWTVEAIGLVYDKSLFDSIVNSMPNPRRKLTTGQLSHIKMEAYRHALSNAGRDKVGGLGPKEIEKLGDQPTDKIAQVRDYVHLLAEYREVNQYQKDKDKLPDTLRDYALSGDHPVEKIIGVMREHGTTDANEIDGILNGASPSISQGWL